MLAVAPLLPNTIYSQTLRAIHARYSIQWRPMRADARTRAMRAHCTDRSPKAELTEKTA